MLDNILKLLLGTEVHLNVLCDVIIASEGAVETEQIIPKCVLEYDGHAYRGRSPNGLMQSAVFHVDQVEDLLIQPHSGQLPCICVDLRREKK